MDFVKEYISRLTNVDASTSKENLIVMKVNNSIIRRTDVSFRCHIAECGHVYGPAEVIDTIHRFGVAYGEIWGADGELTNVIYGIRCITCGTMIIFSQHPTESLLDLRQFMLIPRPRAGEMVYEQIPEEVKRIEAKKQPWLHFRYLSIISNFDQFSHSDYYNLMKKWSNTLILIGNKIPYILSSEAEFFSRAQQEIMNNKILLRRLYPFTPFWENLLFIKKPFDVLMDRNSFETECLNEDVHTFNKRLIAWNNVLEFLADTGLAEAVTNHLTEMNVNVDTKAVSAVLKLSLLEHYLRWVKSQEVQTPLFDYYGHEIEVIEEFKQIRQQVINQAITETNLLTPRNELAAWLDDVESGKCLLIDAPMGLGKTSLVSSELRHRKNISAVLFMPTKKLCQDFIEKYLLYHTNNLYEKWENHKEEIYYIYGITPEECPFFNQLIARQNKRAGRRADVCFKKCGYRDKCRFWIQYEEAKRARIIITTHKQYEQFYNRTDLHSWKMPTESGKNEFIIKKRDLFIIDEDYILSECYEPVTLTLSEVENFIIELRSFIVSSNEHINLIRLLDVFFGRMSEAKKTALVSSIDRDFSFPDTFVKAWNQEFGDEYFYDPRDYPDDVIGNFIHLLEHAIRVGFVVERHGNVHKLHFANPKNFDLSGLPTHVLLDGTLSDEDLLSHKFRNIKFKKHTVSETNLVWPIRIFQNINSDVPVSKIDHDKISVTSFIFFILQTRGLNHNYFIFCSKQIRISYLEEYLNNLKLSNPQFNYVIGHYRSMRGLNEAKNCDICIMVGSYLVSDAVEIAASLDFLSEMLPENDIIETINNLWGWSYSRQREYKPQFSFVQKIANILRESEHRQSLARTRYINHQVDFYIISKEPVENYEPFFNKSFQQEPIHQFCTVLFPPRKPHPDHKYEIIKTVTQEFLKKNDYIRVVDVHNLTGIPRRTIKSNFIKLVTNGILENNGNSYYLKQFTNS